MVGLDDSLFNFDYTLRFMRIVNLGDLELPEVKNLPVFVGIGDKDELFSVEDCRALYDEIPSNIKMFHVVKDGKHAEFPPGSGLHLVAGSRSALNCDIGRSARASGVCPSLVLELLSGGVISS